MSELLVPGAVLALSLAATWRFCLRPMAQGQHCGPARSGRPTNTSPGDPEELARLRGEIGQLRADLAEHRRSAATDR